LSALALVIDCDCLIAMCTIVPLRCVDGNNEVIVRERGAAVAYARCELGEACVIEVRSLGESDITFGQVDDKSLTLLDSSSSMASMYVKFG